MILKFLFIVPAFCLLSIPSFAEDFQCADHNFINKKLKSLGAGKKLTELEEDNVAIDLAYNSGPKSGNFGNEIDMNMMDRLHGLVFMTKENAIGNKPILDMYPALNEDIFKSQKATANLDRSYKHNYSGIFQITYDQVRECRRQILITGFENGKKTSHFTGRINVEICDPKLVQLFAAGAQLFEAQGKKMETLALFFEALDSLANLGKIPKTVVTEIKDNLNIDEHPGVYYAKMENGHIAPRFSVQINSLRFNRVSKDECAMVMVPSSAYSGILAEEEHTFSETIQTTAYQDYNTNQKTPANIEDTMFMHFWLSYWDEKGEVARKRAVLNPLLNKP